MKNRYDVQAAILAYMKSKSSITTLLASNGEIKELQWQGSDDFVYPAVRISMDILPNVADNCPDRVEVAIDTFSEEKSSAEAQQLCDAVAQVFHKKPFSQNGLNFSSVVVTANRKPTRSVFAWVGAVEFYCYVS